MSKRMKRIAVICSLMVGITSMPVDLVHAERVTDTQMMEDVSDTQEGIQLEEQQDTQEETQTEDVPDAQETEGWAVEDATEDDVTLQKPVYVEWPETSDTDESNPVSESETTESATESETDDSLIEGDYADDPEAGRAQGNVSGDFFDDGAYNEDDMYGVATLSDLTGSAGIVHDSKFNGTTRRSGIDVSSWQGDINWSQVKASGIEFAFIRVGYRGYSSGSLAKDSKAIKNLQEAKAAGLKVGIYIFSQAINTSEAQQEADYAINIASSYSLDLPVVMDYEYAAGNDGRLYNAHLSVDAATSIVNAFCERAQSRGYYGMVYANKSMLENQLNASDISSKYPVWLANYTNQTSYGGNYRFWQYTSTGSVSGINGNVDMNVWYDNGSLMGGGYNSSVDVNYSTHIQGSGWLGTVSNGVTSGSTGQGLRMEAIKLSLGNKKYSGGITYSAHVQGLGWQNWVSNGQVGGTTGQAARMEAIKIDLTGEMWNHYDIYYRVHAQNIGWMGWAKNGAPAGTQGYAARLEAIQVLIVDKNAAAPGSTNDSFRRTWITYNTHIQGSGWLSDVHDGAVSGSTGKGLRMEALNMHLESQPYSGGIQYLAHIQGTGWGQGWRSNGQTAGTTGQSARLEAVKIQLTGEMAKHYDVYYRVHAQNIGWMGWAKNGAAAGTTGYSYRLEALQVVLVQKGGSAPGSTNDSFRSR